MPNAVNPTSELPEANPAAGREAIATPPPTKITRRGILMGIGVLLFAVCFTAASLYSRRTQTEKTREVFGDDVITALQLADKVHLLPGAGQEFEPVELTGTPGLGHLRRALLDQNHYRWDTVQSGPVDEVGGADAVRFTLQLADPTGGRVPITKIPMELTQGWIGTPDGSKRVQVNDRVQTALKYQLEILKNKSPKTFDRRAQAEE